MDRLQAMQVFTRVVDTSSFTKAAETLSLPRASVTTIIQNLEAFLGVRLMHRTTRRLSLTPDGAAYYERCVRILADVEETEASFQANNRKPHGKLRIDMPGSIGRLLVIPSLCEFHTRYPDIDLQLGLSDRPVDLLQEGVDCVIRVGALQDSSLVARRVGLFECVTVASPDYLERHGEPQTIDDLNQHKAVNYFEPHRPHDRLDVPDRRQGSRDEDGRHRVGERRGCVRDLRDRRLRADPAAALHGAAASARRPAQEVLPGVKPLPMPISVVYPHSRHLSPKVRVFVDWIAEVFDRCPLLSGKGSLDATCSKRTFEEAERAPALDTPVINEWVA